MRLLEILKDRFGALEAAAYSSIKLAHYAPEDELSMDLLGAQSVLEFGSSLRDALDGAGEWARARGVGPIYVRSAGQPRGGSPAAATMLAQPSNARINRRAATRNVA
jgi:hypothetical protein